MDYPPPPVPEEAASVAQLNPQVEEKEEETTTNDSERAPLSSSPATTAPIAEESIPKSTNASASEATPPIAIPKQSPQQQQRHTSASPSATSPSSASNGGWGSWLGGLKLGAIAKPASEGLSVLSNIVSTLVLDNDEVHISKEEEEELGITPSLIEFVENVSKHPSTFEHFPLEEDDVSGGSGLIHPPSPAPSSLSSTVHAGNNAGSSLLAQAAHRKRSLTADLVNDMPSSAGAALIFEKRRRYASTPFKLTQKQMRHVTAMLALVPSLQKIRHDLVPLALEEDVFWKIYFELIKRKTPGMDWGQSAYIDSEQEAALKKQIHAKLKLKRELILSQYDIVGSGTETARRLWYTDSKIKGYREKEMMLKDPVDPEWDSIVLNGLESSESISAQYTALIRSRGIGHAHRHEMWGALTGAHIFIDRYPNFYAHALKRVFAQTDLVQVSTLTPRSSKVRQVLLDQKKTMEAIEQAEGMAEQAEQTEQATTPKEEEATPSQEAVTSETPKADEKEKEKESEHTQAETSSPSASPLRLPQRRASRSLSRSVNLEFAEIPKHSKHVPLFGGLFCPHDHPGLTKEGIECARRILTVAAIDNPLLNHIPFLPDLVLMSLQHLAEDEVYALVQQILQDTIKPPYLSAVMKDKPMRSYMHQQLRLSDPKHTANILSYVPKHRHEFNLLVQNYLDMMPTVLPELIAHVNNNELLEITDIREELNVWFARMFILALPYSVALKVFDNMLNEGCYLVFYKVATACLLRIQSALMQHKDSYKFVMTLRESMLTLRDKLESPEEGDAFIKSTMAIEIPLTDLVLVNHKNRQKWEESEIIEDPIMEVSMTPHVKGSSQLISEYQFQVLWQWLPQRYQLSEMSLVFSSSVDGFSLINFFRHTQDIKAHYLIIRTKDNKVFGAFCNTGWQPSKTFFGMGECFLFSLMPKSQQFKWVGRSQGTGSTVSSGGRAEQHKADLFMQASDEGIVIGGGGGAGIMLDAELWHGVSEFCETFRNDPLNGADTKDFECVGLEIFAIRH